MTTFQAVGREEGEESTARLRGKKKWWIRPDFTTEKILASAAGLDGQRAVARTNELDPWAWKMGHRHEDMWSVDQFLVES